MTLTGQYVRRAALAERSQVADRFRYCELHKNQHFLGNFRVKMQR